MKTIWITSLVDEGERVQALATQLGAYGLQAGGHVWVDDLKQRAWSAPRKQLEEHDLWLILSTDETLGSAITRLGLSLAALCVQAVKGYGTPIVLAHQGTLPQAGTLPTPLSGATILGADDPTLGAKITAAVHGGVREIDPGYRLDLHLLPHGICFEVGPTGEPWQGVLFGTQETEAGVELGAQAVGPPGSLPEKCTLEYPISDIKLILGGDPYKACALKNTIGQDDAYYVLVQGDPAGVVFGPFEDSEDAAPELFSLKL